MRIRIACVGKCKEKYWESAVNEYVRRLSRYAQVSVYEVPDEPAPERLSEAQRVQVMAREGERLLKGIGERDFVAALCVDGKRYTSEAFAQALPMWLEAGGAAVTFVIGGSLGIAPEVLRRANARMSLSDMTFPHQLARILLLEQVYRGFKLNANEPYHK